MVAVAALVLVPVPAQAIQPSQTAGLTVSTVDTGERAVQRKIVNNCDRVVARPRHIDWCGNTASRFRHLTWNKWAKHEALARGIGHFNDCLPSCAEGTMHNYRVAVRLHRDVWVKGHPRFSRLTWRYVNGPDNKRRTIPLLLKPY